MSPLSWPPFTFLKKLTRLQWLRGPIRECCLYSSSLSLSLILISAATGTVSILAQRESTPSTQTTTSPLYQSSKSPLGYWPVLKSGGNYVKTFRQDTSWTKTLSWTWQNTLKTIFFLLCKSQLCHLIKNKTQHGKQNFNSSKSDGVNMRKGARPNINDSCSYYSPRILN